MPRVSKNLKSINDIIVDYLEFCSYKVMAINCILYL